jgi:hypothetical protein
MEEQLAKSERPVADMFLEHSPKREINISPLDYGYIVRVGCQTLAIESKQDLIKHLTDYLNNQNETENKYNNKQLLKHQ